MTGDVSARSERIAIINTELELRGVAGSWHRRAAPVPNSYELDEQAATDLIERNLSEEAMSRLRVAAATFDRPVLEGGSMRRRSNASIRR
jgi:hypothetical protein